MKLYYFLTFLGIQMLGISGRERKVSTSRALAQAIMLAQPGDKIKVAPGTYNGQFLAFRRGSESAPILVEGVKQKTKIVGSGHGTAFRLMGSHWSLQDMKISGYDRAVTVHGSDNRLGGLAIDSVDEGIYVRGKNSKVQGSAIQNLKKYGIRVRGSNAELAGNVIQDSDSPAIILEKESCCGSVKGNVANGPVTVAGSNYNFSGNVFQGTVSVTGCGNSLAGNIGPTPKMSQECPINDLGGNWFI